MKTLRASLTRAIALLFCAQVTSAVAVTFIHDNFISFADGSYDGQDIVVTNCTLTVDGTHTFNSLQLLNGAVLTHSPFPYGSQEFMVSVSDETHTLSAVTPAVLSNTNIDSSSILVFDSSANLLYTEGVDYVVTISNQFTELTLTTNSAIAEGATVLVDYDWAQDFQGFNLSINNDLQITPGGAINVSGKGYAGGIGFLNGAGTSHATNYPFAFTAGGGGAHGGSGGASSTFARGGGAYDSTTSPAALGSGGGTGSAGGGGGGGVAILTVGGNLQVDGQIFASGLKGTNAHSGGGAGGSILISAQRVSGAGGISANGGSADLPDGGGGGGGRIAIYFGTNNFAGTISAFGGNGAMAGGAGTIYLQSMVNAAGQLFIANAGKRGTNTTFSAPISDLTISGGAIAQPQVSAFSVTNLFVGSNSWLVPLDGTPLALTVNGNATMESNAAINADFRSTSGLGAGGASCGAGSGGSYGGFGGASVCGTPGGAVYGSVTQPANLGSPGGAGPIVPGGGAINLNVAGTLSLAGTISANGASASAPTSGGGSGGSVWLTVGTLAGGGTISANGGPADNLVGGGGGGGRVAIYFKTNLFSGTFTAYGGAGTNYGGAGTIYAAHFTGGQVTLPFPAAPPFPQVIVDNGGNRGATTPLSALSGVYDLTVAGRAAVSNTTSTTIQVGNLLVGSNSVFLTYPFSQQQISVASNATIMPGGSVNADGASQQSPGNGQTLNLTGGGGASAGSGGASALKAPGGIPFSDSVITPVSSGGRGGSGFNGGSGGNGGGSFKMTVGGTLQVDGRISAEGAASSTFNGGGGAGGTVSLSAKVLSGSGVISANGGAGNGAGGGGGGGHVAISYSTNLFVGNLTAHGGSGTNFGGAGFIYTASTVQFVGPGTQLIVDNGGTSGGYTLLSTPPQNFSFTIIGGAILTNASGQFTLNSLFIGSNSTMLTPPVRTMITVLTNATVQAGAKITVDGSSTGGVGQGQILSSSGGGGGHGGYGGASFLNALGGPVILDSVSEPEVGGSPGGFGGGNGGGALQISVRGILQLDGKISAEGVTSSNLNSGGGSGGAIWLSVGKLLGGGSISANGGAGNNGGGGGGGGRIAIWSNTNSFAGSVMARGGSGANFGGAGTIYTTSSFFGQGKSSQLIVDNGGARGTNTLISASGNPQDLVVGGGSSVTFSPLTDNGLTWNSLTVSSNAVVSFAPNNGILALNVTTSLTVQPGGSINIDGLGFAANAGNGHGSPNTGSPGGGAGHGGYGSAGNQATAAGGASYDSISAPAMAGSGGGSSSPNSSAGGGALHLTVSGIMTINGVLSANGKPGIVSGAGGGSGGSLWLNAGTISGTGKISVDGGSGEFFGGGGGGGGGRIAAYFNTNQFAGKFSARGGLGAFLAGGAGTIYLKTNSANIAQLILDDGGVTGTNTPLDLFPQGAGLSISNGAAASSAAAVTVQNLSIGPGGFFNANPTQSLNLTVLGNAAISAGGGMNANAMGDNAGIFPGAGSADSYGDGSGGGYGGYGGASFFGAPGGGTYGSATQPTDFGSSGGSFPAVPGFSQGGGAIRLHVTGALSVAGNISANGQDGIIDGSGGGSGGSIWINAQSFSGSGNVTANGGRGESDEGGGGGGGRIAIYAGTNSFAGNIVASGGEGAFAGLDGTVYILTNLLVSGNIIDKNGAAIAGMNIQLNGSPSSTTDGNGYYSVIVPPAWSGTIAPIGNGPFIPAARTYSNLSSNAPNQNFLAASPSDFNFSGGQFDGANVNFNWFGIQSVRYQPLYSTNLVDWMPYGPPIIGSNVLATLAFPSTNAPQMYFRLQVNY